MKTDHCLLINICFSEITPESAESGDTSDNGLITENEPLTFRELVDKIWQGGFAREGLTGWLSTGYSVIDYSTLTEREETLHFSRDNPPYMEKYFWQALRYVEAKRRKQASL